MSKDGKVGQKEQADLGRYRLQTEQVNPIYQELATEVNQEWIETARELGRPVPEPQGRLIFA